MTRPAAPSGVPEDIWTEILKEDEPDDDGDEAADDLRREDAPDEAGDEAKDAPAEEEEYLWGV